MAVTEYGLVAYFEIVVYLYLYLYHPTSGVATLRQPRNICAIQRNYKRRKDISEIFQYFL